MTSISLPLDEDGFLRRECPNCQGQFKWHHGPTGNEPEDAVDPPFYYCPLCGAPSGPDTWWTQEQAEYLRAIDLGEAMTGLHEEFKRLERRTRGGMISFKASGDQPEPPSSLHEPDDMGIVASPCHPWEPVKVPEDCGDPLHCLLCGSAYQLD